MSRALRWLPCAFMSLLPIQACDQQTPENPLVDKLEGRIHSNAEYAYPLPYRLFVPANYDRTAAYPIVVYLHGGGARGRNNKKQLDEGAALAVSDEVQSIESSFVLAPQCPKGDQWVSAAHDPPFTNYDQTKVPESDASKMVFEIIAALQGEFSIDANRIYITGASMGGSGSWDLITRHPGIFAAAAPVTGVNDPSRASVIASLPVWAFHGELDRVSPVENTREMVAVLRQLGSPIKYSEFQGVGHNSWTPAYSSIELYQWMFAQRLPAGDPPPATAH